MLPVVPPQLSYAAKHNSSHTVECDATAPQDNGEVPASLWFAGALRWVRRALYLPACTLPVRYLTALSST